MARTRRNATGMHLSDHDLRELDEPYLDTLSPEQVRVLLGKAQADLKAARERLGQNPTNSSRPPSTRAPPGSSPLQTRTRSKRHRHRH
jgi:hypothetical protein